MLRRTASLLHRGFLWAQKRVKAYQHETPDSLTSRRMERARAWKAGYKACQNDTRRRKC